MASFKPANDSDVPEGSCTETWFMTCATSRLFCCLPCNPLLHCCRKLVSQKKMRYQEDGFDLDMAYTSPGEKRVLTLGFPSAGLEHLYRNPRLEVRKYLERYHHERYKIFNLCCEPGRHYDAALFENRVERWPFRDHCVPPLETMLGLSNSAKQWIDENPENMLAIHCKAGKGRAGIMTCVVLLRLGYFDTADEVMDHYDRVRVSNNRGLTVMSQRRAVRHFEKLWRNIWKVQGSLKDVPADDDLRSAQRQLPEQPTKRITGISLVNVDFNGKSCNDFTLANLTCKVYRGGSFDPVLLYEGRLPADGATEGEYKWKVDVKVQGNFLVKIMDVQFLIPTVPIKAPMLAKRKKFCEAWENTAFVEGNMLSFPMDELDMKKKLRRRVSENMKLVITFETGKGIQGSQALEIAGPSEQI